MIVHRFTPVHRNGSGDFVSLDATAAQARRAYWARRRTCGERPFVARLVTIGMYCAEVQP